MATHPIPCARTLTIALNDWTLTMHTQHLCARRWELEPAVCRAIRFAEVQLSDNINQVG